MQQVSTIGVQDLAPLGLKGKSLEIVQEIKMHKSESIRENEAHKIIWNFQMKTDHLIPARRPDLVLITNKITFHRDDFAVPSDHRVKIKENEKINKNLDIATKKNKKNKKKKIKENTEYERHEKTKRKY